MEQWIALSALEKFTGRKFTAGEVLAVRVIPMKDQNVMRVVRGPLACVIRLNYESADLTSLQDELDFALKELRLGALFEDIAIHRGGSHIDVIQVGKGSLDLLSVSDHAHHNLK